MDIRDRLEEKYRNHRNINGHSEDPRPKKEIESSALNDISKYVTGSFIPTPTGDIFIARHTYDMDHLHGELPLSEISKLKDKDIKILAASSAEHCFDKYKTLFLDTETTGLSGGAGTAAFLIGVGFFFENKFIVEQYFMRDYDEETVMLERLAERAADFDVIVTFNGRTFDLPLLEARMILNRIDPVLSRLRDVDLLHPARRIWGMSFKDCRLGTLEEEVLKFERSENDIPSSLIPGIYFDFVRSGDADPLYKVFYHNEKDVVSMVGLLYKEYQYLSNPLNESSATPIDLYNMGRYFERSRDWTMAVACFEKAVPDLDFKFRSESLIKISMIHKRQAHWSTAIGIWKDLIKVDGPFRILPYVELAKYFEHKEKQFDVALNFARAALDKISIRRSNDIDEINHRIKRLERKLGLDNSA